LEEIGVGVIDIHMKNVKLDWAVESDVRNICLDALRCVNESTVNRVMLLHALTVIEMVSEGLFDTAAAAEIYEGYPGLKNSLPSFLHHIKNFPEMVWYSPTEGIAQCEDPPFEDCGLCLDEDWEEAILCPQCYGSGKIGIINFHPIKTMDILISKSISRIIL
jgi:hypothetical protein